ncbi:ABC transporter permease [Haloprofundus salinisoli]|uniref:ABC transporter permease n=1 Tax=Haloprofundus salinisoli TaxID=2876193 RepID=UPI001CCAF455|nr:ABC transporter permease [Haloprofundus salinisoli]
MSEFNSEENRPAEASVFERVSEAHSEPLSRQERLERWYYDTVVVTAKIIWEDIRARIGISILLFIILMGVVGPFIVERPQIGDYPKFIGPFQSTKFILGTDGLGMPIGAQIVHATPAMLKMAFAGAVVAMSIGIVIGTTAGYKGGRVDDVLMTLTDIVLTMPGLPLIVVLAAIYQPENPYVVGFILAIDNWPGLARRLRSQVLTIREESYVEASRAMGFGSPEILRRDIIPQLMPYITINSAGAARSIIYESVGLYFLGILPFTTLNWGVMMNMAYSNGAVSNPMLSGHWLWFPMLVLLLLSLGLILFSQGMDRIFNPRLRARHQRSGDDGDSTNPAVVE